MKMGLYKLFSCNPEIQYKSYFLSKAMVFTLLTWFLTVVLPFVLAYRSRGLWLKHHHFFEQPTVHFTYEYLVVAETDDPSQPIVCGEADILNNSNESFEEYCAELQVQETDYNRDGKNEMIDFKIRINIPRGRTIVSAILLFALDFQFKSECPLHMQSLAIVEKEFVVPPSGLKYLGDLEFYQVTHLPCLRHHIDTKYNVSLFSYHKDSNQNVVDYILDHYFKREVTTKTNKLYSRSQHGHTGEFNIDVRLRIPKVKIQYLTSLLQEFKWAWPQYLSLAFIFHWVFYKIKKFVFKNRLLMAWEVVPWKKT